MTKKKDIDYVHIESVSTWCGAVRACDVVPELTALVSPIFPILSYCRSRPRRRVAPPFSPVAESGKDSVQIFPDRLAR